MKSIQKRGDVSLTSAHPVKQKSSEVTAMAKQGDAYPDPRRMHSGRFRARTLICIGLVLIFLGCSLAVIAADPWPDPRSIHGPLFSGYSHEDLPMGNSVIGNQAILL
jgi:hypothetical protein